MSATRIGLFGGTFDPPHIGHLVAAHQVREQRGFDEVWLVVANHPWQKDGSRVISPAEQRLAWTRSTVEGVEGLVASDIELEMGGSSYTIDTVVELRRRRPEAEFSIVVGADAAAGLDTWHRADELARLVSVIVVNRPGDHAAPPSGWTTEFVPIPALDISSSELRSMVAEGRSVRFLVNDEVIASLDASGAYRQGS